MWLYFFSLKMVAVMMELEGRVGRRVRDLVVSGEKKKGLDFVRIVARYFKLILKVNLLDI